MEIVKSNTANSAILGIYRLLLIFFLIFTIYFAQTVVVPLFLAALLTFLLAPIVTKLEKWIGRIPSILLIVILVFSTIGLASYALVKQIILFGSNIPDYMENIQKKLQAFQFLQWQIIDRLSHIFENLKEALFGGARVVDTYAKVSSPEIKLIDLTAYVTSIAEWLSGSLFNVLGSTALVLLLVIFMLLNKEDIRSRIIKLIGPRRISSAASTLDDAGERVYDYLSRLFIVNLCFGICVSAGLFLIGVPNAILWGCLSGILRFIPYIGSWIAAIIPIAISFIITDTWFVPALTISFFIILDIITAYVIEPFYYGSGTGVSSFAIIFSAIFWTWLLGPVGLLLSTPITVCLVVIGKHMTDMQFLSVLLSEEQALTDTEECYHRLLSFDSSESMDVIESYLKKNSLISLYDSVLIPIITQTQIDFHLDIIDAQKKESLYQSIREIVELLSISEKKEMTTVAAEKGKILCLPARTARDELGVNLLTQLLLNESFEAYQTTRIDLSDILELVEKIKPKAVCITLVAPFVSSHAQYLCSNLHQRLPQLPIVIGLFGFPQAAPEILDKLNAAGATKVVFSLSQMLETLETRSV